MPGSVKSLSKYSGYQSEKQCKKTSFAFYQAVRDLLPVWVLEDMRIMEVLHWEEGGNVSAYSPSEALLYALVHDHKPYAQYLLSHFPQDALAMPSRNFSCCQSSAPHLTMAVRYDRVEILRRILRTLRDLPASSRSAYINRRGCCRVEGGKTPVHLACELHRAECLMLLLGCGACPYITDSSGNTPLDTLLQLLGGKQQDVRVTRLCLDTLLLYMPEGPLFKCRNELQENPLQWKGLLGKHLYIWLTGASPPSLFTISMQALLRSVPPERFPEALEGLPLPDFLKPPALAKKELNHL
ncbi:ankyrin repeat domain-containing protein 9 [Bombina bombina]|uniref:ankyrin repeat domain-containing protein 9 n=1 Tax=Bombina bombina TaxID=8345 RepID=UPI00235A9879|nr:ankyrin repeat domain-containing protein 9 [Bombina bombina]XP_053553407.1 ankyrin repeat domain-containing protein 9 [Bombina bombina]